MSFFDIEIRLMPFNNRSFINGTYLPPGDKSISHRILILTGQAIGKSEITNLLEGEDVINTLKAMKLLGIQIKKKNSNSLNVINGNSSQFHDKCICILSTKGRSNNCSSIYKRRSGACTKSTSFTLMNTTGLRL